MGDVVLLKDSQVRRTEWPTGLVKTVPSQDNRVRTVGVKVVKQGMTYLILGHLTGIKTTCRGITCYPGVLTRMSPPGGGSEL